MLMTNCWQLKVIPTSVNNNELMATYKHVKFDIYTDKLLSNMSMYCF